VRKSNTASLLSQESTSSVQSFIIGMEYNIMEFNVSDGHVACEWRLGFSGQNERISALAAFRANAWEDEYAPPEKRARKGGARSLHSFLCAGTLDAKLLLWEGSTLKAEFKMDSGAEILSIAPMQDNSGRIFVLTNSSSSPLYSIHYASRAQTNGNPVAKVTPNLRGASGNEKFTSIATLHHQNQSYLLIGTSQGSVYIVDTVSMSASTKLVGHTSSVTKMAVLNGFLVTSSDTDLFANVYDLRGKNGITSSPVVRPFKNLQTPSEVTSVDINQVHKGKASTLEVCAVCSTKASLVWRFGFPKSIPKTSLPTSVEVDHTCHVEPMRGGWIGAAAFTSDTAGHSNVVYLLGSLLVPRFQRVNQLESKLILEEPVQKDKESKKTDYVDTSKVKVVGAKQLVQKTKQDDVWQDLRLPEDLDTDKIAETRTAGIESKPAFHKLLKRQSQEQSFMPEDITSVFVQCVSRGRFEDVRFKAIMSSTDRDVVYSSVRSLPADFVKSFFKFLDEQLHTTKAPFWRMESAMVWLTAVLAVHGKVLQRVNGIDLHLQKSMQIAQERVSHQNMIMSLSGKLDMLLGMAKYPMAHFDPETDPEIVDADMDKKSAEIVIQREEDIVFHEPEDDDTMQNL